MADVELSYKGAIIGNMSASGSLTLETAGKYCEDAIEVEYTKPSGPTPTGTKAITISGPGTVTEDVTNYAAAEITVPAGSAATPATTVPVTPAISVDANGLITASVSASQNVTPSVSPGFVSDGTAGTVSVSGSNTSQLPVYAGAHHSGTPTPSTISFYIDNVPYTADSGMSWTQWVASAYNTDGYQISGGVVKDSMGMMGVEGPQGLVSPSDTITENELYGTAPA